LFLVFLTPMIFSLEFIRQRIISETENFINLCRASNIKFPFVIGPFVVKSRSCLSEVKAKIKDFGFSKIQGRKYDPHWIIFKRRQMNKNAPYEHEYVEGLEKLANLQVCTDVEAPL
jgi:hypothetical protein